VRRIVSELPPHAAGLTLLDLGCGAGACGAAWGSLVGRNVIGVDSHPWAMAEAPHAYRAFELKFDVRRGSVARLSLPRAADAIVAGWMVNELDERSRAALLETLLDAASTGVGVLIVEPIATRATPWWQGWSDEFARLGGRASEWRFPVQLPNWLAKLDRAAGMHHDELTAKSLYIGPRAPF
jgi:cyclopropane fatty-acyl-phospholipid synthase-like methyltransferase